MELPKNIVQIGKPDKTHKIFVEDYVVSYIKQLNRSCDGRAVGLALYGRFYEEDECRYYFLYGASVITGLEHRGPYLTQVEKEEIADVGRRYFEEYDFLAWCSVKEEPVDGFYVMVQGKGIEVNGYACFYEKNESMLNYMLLISRQEKKEERVNDGTEAVKPARGEWRTTDYVKTVEKPVREMQAAKSVAKKTEYMKMAVAAMFLVLCVIGITTLNDYEKLEDLQVAARQVIASLTEQKLPDEKQPGRTISENVATAQEDAGTVSTDVTRAEQDSADIVRMEETTTDETQTEQNSSDGVQAEQTDTDEAQTELSSAGDAQTAQTSTDDVQAQQDSLPVSYTIVKGDTLISICMKKYGSLDKLQEICEINDIANPDSIAVGQTILLPQ